MLGTDIALKHQIAIDRHQEFIAEARRQHELDNAFGLNDRRRVDRLTGARTTMATALLRIAAWLMPEDVRTRPAAGGLELRPGR